MAQTPAVASCVPVCLALSGAVGIGHQEELGTLWTPACDAQALWNTDFM